MANVISLPISGPAFWSNVEAALASSSGVARFLDPEGDVQYVAMRLSVRMEIVRRTTEQLFEDYVADFDRFAHYHAVINGNMYDVGAVGLLDALEGHDPVAPEHTRP